ncbi:28S ribosomal protein S11, mitochondrial [Halotydeus destructor]|nr:28S ribosomal protein S11, mitochondrial [Halotydeus destructor]
MTLRLKTMFLVRQMLNVRNLDMYVPSVASLHTSKMVAKGEDRDRRDMLRTVPKKDEGTQGIAGVGVDLFANKSHTFVDINTATEIFHGVPFSMLPIISIKTSPNNTLMTASDHHGKIILNKSCGTEGFKNCRKGTNVAAETTGISLAQKLVKLGVTSVRVCVQGLGPGRMSSVKGLVAGGLEIISITDVTPFCDKPPRARAAKSL